jgi:hypothetical protein
LLPRNHECRRESSPRDRHLLITAAAARLRPWAVVSHHSAACGRGKYLGEFDPGGPSAEAAARVVVAEKVREDRMRDCGLEFVRWDLAMMLSDGAGVATQANKARNRGEGSRFTGQLAPPSPRLPAAKTPSKVRQAS